MISIDLPDEAEKRLQTLADEHGKSKEEWVRALILEYLEDLQDFHEAERRMSNFDPAKASTLEEFVACYGMDD
jgi:predicted DNA-binding protein